MATTQYGANAPFTTDSGGFPVDPDPIFTAAVDDLALHGQTWARLGANQNVVLATTGASCSATSLTWQTARVALLTARINYIRAKGMRVYLYIEPPTTFTTHTLSAQTNAGSNVFTIESASNTQAGMVVGGVWTVGFGGSAEDFRIQSISGNTITMTSAAVYTHPVGTAVAMAVDDYKNVIKMWAGFLAQTWAGLVDVWQVGNENNIGDFRNRSNNTNLTFTGATVPALSATYTGEMATMLAAARTAIRLHDAAPITTNVGANNLGYDLTAQLQYVQYFDAVNPSIDLLAMDQYDPMDTGVGTKVFYINGLKSRYSKEIIISEVGYWWSPLSGQPSATEANQARILAQQVAALQQASPLAIILYQYRDEAGIYIYPTQYLGILKNTGAQTQGYPAWFLAQVPASAPQTPALGTRPYLWVLDHTGNRVSNIYGIDVDSALRGITNLRYTPEGAVLDKLGTISFQAPPSAPINRALQPGIQVQVVDPAILTNNQPTIVAWGVYNTGSRTVNRAGTVATFTFDDVFQELVRNSATSGFATANNSSGVATEGVTAILTRLVSLNVETSWAVANTLTTLDGISFQASNTSIFAAAVKLANERKAHVKRGVGRTLKFGRYGEDSGLIFRNGVPDPTGSIAEPTFRLIPDGGLQSTLDSKIVNVVVPTGGDTGILQVTLAPLYNRAGETATAIAGWFLSGPLSFVGADWQNHPIYRRPRADGGGIDGNDYLLQDNFSLLTYGRNEGPSPSEWASIVPTKNDSGGVAQADRIAACAALYQLAISYLQWNSVPREVLTITTPALGDIRDIAGKTVTLRYQDDTQGISYGATDPVTGAPRTWVVMEVSRTADNSPMDTWTISSLGSYQKEPAAIYAGVVATLSDMKNAAVTVRTPYPASASDNCDNGYPISVTFHGNSGIQQIISARAWLTPSAMRSEATPLSHVHATPNTTHDVNALPHDVNALPHDVSALGHDVNALPIHFSVGGVPTTGTVDYDPGSRLAVTRVTTAPGSAHAVYYDAVNDSFYVADGSSGTKQAQISSSHLGIASATTNATAGGTGGSTKATAGGTGGSTKASSGGNGGAVKATTNGTGGTVYGVSNPAFLDAQVGMKYAMATNGPVPTGAAIWIGTTMIAKASGSAALGPIDISAYISQNMQGAVTVEGHCDSLGHLTLEVFVEYMQSSL